MECTGEIAIRSGQPPRDLPTIRFPGQYYDEETGLHYNRLRYYDPSIGRYISADPIGQAGGLNVYRYASSNPIGWIDPSGGVSWRAIRNAVNNRGKTHKVPGGELSEQQALRRRLNGGDVQAEGEDAYEAARRLEQRVADSVGGDLLEHDPHHSSPSFSAHFQTGGHQGHTFFKLLSASLIAFFAPPAYDAGAAYFDFFLNAGENFGEAPECSDGGPPGGDELHGQFTGTLGSLNRPR